MSTRRRTAQRAGQESMRRSALGLITVVCLCFAGLVPADAASKPGGVGLVSYKAASRTSLTVAWHKASLATKYQVFLSSSYSGVLKAKPIATTKALKYTAKGLTPGVNYYIQVRAKNDSATGSKSPRVGHRTIRAQGTATGPIYKVLTYNLCSYVSACDRVPHTWASREAAAVGKIKALNADVVAAQEANNLDEDDLPGYSVAKYYSGKKLLYKTSRFNHVRGSYITMSAEHKKYSVWAELEDIESKQHVIFVNVHTSAGKSDSAALRRRAEIIELLSRLKAINTESVPVVLAGDFNSHKGRSNDNLMRTPLHHSGLYDAYDLAMNLYRQHHNSYSQPSHDDSDPWVTKPMIGMKWGDHVDHMWVDPTKTQVRWWRNVATFSGSLLAKPIPSDHNPLLFEVQVN